MRKYSSFSSLLSQIDTQRLRCYAKLETVLWTTLYANAYHCRRQDILVFSLPCTFPVPDTWEYFLNLALQVLCPGR